MANLATSLSFFTFKLLALASGSSVGNIAIYWGQNGNEGTLVRHVPQENRLQRTFKLSVFTAKAYTPKSLSGFLPPDSGPTQKIF